VFEIRKTVGRGADGLNGETGQVGRSRIGPMRRVWNEDFFAGIPLRLVIGANHEDSSQFTVRSGGRLQGHSIHAANLGKTTFQALLDFECPLYPFHRQIRMRHRKTFQPHHPFIDFRVVLHRARA